MCIYTRACARVSRHVTRQPYVRVRRGLNANEIEDRDINPTSNSPRSKPPGKYGMCTGCPAKTAYGHRWFTFEVVAKFAGPWHEFTGLFGTSVPPWLIAEIPSLIRRLSRLARLRGNPPALSVATPPGYRAGSLVIKYSPETQYCGARRNREIDVFLGFIIKDIVTVSSCPRQKKQGDLSCLREESLL